MSTEQKVYKVISARIKGFKHIKELTIEPNGRGVFLMGPNEQGKTSAIQAIWVALGSRRVPDQPIMTGEDKAEIMVIIGKDGFEYTIEKTFTRDKKPTLKITSPDGLSTTKVTALENIVGNIDFDIIEFVDLAVNAEGRRKQVQMIRGFLPKETNEKLDTLDAEIKAIDTERTAINVKVRNLEERLKGLNLTEDDFENFSEPSDAAKLMEELDVLRKANTDLKNKRQKLDMAKQLIDKDAQEISQLQTRIKVLQENSQKLQAAYDAGSKELEGQEEKPTEELETKIKNSSEHTKKYEKVKEHHLLNTELETLTHQYNEKTESRAVKYGERAKLIKDSKLPVEGLTFDDEGLKLGELPVSSQQQSTSQLMEIGYKLAVAQLKQNKVFTGIVHVPRVESMDNTKLEAMQKFMEENDIQPFYEEVDREATELQFKYVEHEAQ